MFKNKPTAEEELLNEKINHALSRLDPVMRTETEYREIVNHLNVLLGLRDKIQGSKSKSRVSPDTMAIVVGNLVGIAMIVGHEKAHVATSKAFNFIMKAST